MGAACDTGFDDAGATALEGDAGAELQNAFREGDSRQNGSIRFWWLWLTRRDAYNEREDIRKRGATHYFRLVHCARGSCRRVLRGVGGGRTVDFVVNGDGLGGGEDFGNEVLLVGLSGESDVGLCEDVLEVDDLECFAGCGGEEGAGRGEGGRTAWPPWVVLVVVAGGEGCGPKKAMEGGVTNRDGGGRRHLTGRGGGCSWLVRLRS